MNRYLISLLSVVCGLYVMAEEKTDTILSIAQPDSVIIKTEAGRLDLEVIGRKDNPEYHYLFSHSISNKDTLQISESKNSRWNFHIPFVDKKISALGRFEEKNTFSVLGVGLGFVGAVNATQGMDVNTWNSYEIFVRWINLSHRFRGINLNVGIGSTWRNYRMTEPLQFVADEGCMDIMPLPEGSVPRYSGIKIRSFNVPVSISYPVGKFWMAIGPVLNINNKSWIKTKYLADGNVVKSECKDIPVRKVTVDLMANVGFGDTPLSLYVKYSPWDVMKTDFAPKFNHLSFGLTLLW